MCKRYLNKEICETCKYYVQHYTIQKYILHQVACFHCLKSDALKGIKETTCPLYEKGRNKNYRNKHIDLLNKAFRLEAYTQQLLKELKALK